MNGILPSSGAIKPAGQKDRLVTRHLQRMIGHRDAGSPGQCQCDGFPAFHAMGVRVLRKLRHGKTAVLIQNAGLRPCATERASRCKQQLQVLGGLVPKPHALRCAKQIPETVDRRCRATALSGAKATPRVTHLRVVPYAGSHTDGNRRTLDYTGGQNDHQDTRKQGRAQTTDCPSVEALRGIGALSPQTHGHRQARWPCIAATLCLSGR